MNKTDFRRLFRYSDNCWRLLGETLAAAPQAPAAWAAPFETPSRWNTVRLLLAHTIAAEERWVTVRLRDQPLPVGYEERAASDWPSIYHDLRTVRAATYAYLDSLTDAEVEGEKEAWRTPWGVGTVADALFQILNHETYHRGQIVMALRQQGIDPPDFDYVLLKGPAGQAGD